MTSEWVKQNLELLEKLKKAMDLLEGYGDIVIKYQDGRLVDLRVHPSIRVG